MKKFSLWQGIMKNDQTFIFILPKSDREDKGRDTDINKMMKTNPVSCDTHRCLKFDEKIFDLDAQNFGMVIKLSSLQKVLTVDI